MESGVKGAVVCGHYGGLGKKRKPYTVTMKSEVERGHLMLSLWKIEGNGQSYAFTIESGVKKGTSCTVTMGCRITRGRPVLSLWGVG